MRALAWAAAALVAMVAGGGVLLCERALHIYGSLRWLPPREVAESVAKATGTTLRDAEIRAADGAELRAWVWEPREPGPGVVLALHGVGASRQHMLGHAAMLARNGFAVIAPDSRGHGASGGDLVTYGLRESGDVGAWLDWAQANLSTGRMFGLGESMGAATILESLRTERRFAAVVAEAPYSSFGDMARSRVGLAPVVEVAFLYSRLRYGVDLRLVSPADAVRGSRVPILLIHSEADRNVPLWHSRRIRDAEPYSIELWEPPGVEHTQAATSIPDQFEHRVVSFFRSAVP
jgi:dipeptidyl aminopeptidase/acylaminoacyl peptidase